MLECCPGKERPQGENSLISIASVDTIWLLILKMLFPKSIFLISEALYARAICDISAVKIPIGFSDSVFPILFDRGNLLFTTQLFTSHKPRVSWNTLWTTLLLILITRDLSILAKRAKGTFKKLVLELCKSRTVMSLIHCKIVWCQLYMQNMILWRNKNLFSLGKRTRRAFWHFCIRLWKQERATSVAMAAILYRHGMQHVKCG